MFKLKVNQVTAKVPTAFILRPAAENDEIYLESRSSELLLRNGISDISEGQQLMDKTFTVLVLRPECIVYCRCRLRTFQKMHSFSV